MSAGVQRLDHRLELLHLLAGVLERGVAVVRREEADRVVAPVVRQPLLDEGRVVDELVHRHELDRGHAERGEVLDDRGVGEPGVGAAQLLRDGRVLHRQAAHVRLVDDRLVVLVLRRPVVAPVEVRVDDDRRHRVRGRVVVVALLRVVELVRVQRRVAVDLPVDRLGVRVEQQLVRVAAVTLRRVVRPVHPVPVALPGRDGGQVPVPHERVDLGQVRPGLGAVRRRSGTARLVRPPRRTGRSSSRSRRRWRPGGRGVPATSAWPPGCQSTAHPARGASP